MVGNSVTSALALRHRTKVVDFRLFQIEPVFDLPDTMLLLIEILVKRLGFDGEAFGVDGVEIRSENS